MVTINGEEKNAAGKTVSEYLEEAGYQANRVVVERNLEILPRGDYPRAVLKDGDILEIVGFVGGG